jgi:hypothetical protein
MRVSRMSCRIERFIESPLRHPGLKEIAPVEAGFNQQ